MGISTTLLESTEEVVDAKTSVEESPLAAQGTSLLAQCRSSSHMSCCDIGVPRDCIQRYMLRDVRWFELCAGKGDLRFPGWPHGFLDWFRDYGVGFFTTSLTSYIERLNFRRCFPQYARTSMPGRRRYAWRVFSRRHFLALPTGSLTRAMTEREICVLVVIELFGLTRTSATTDQTCVHP